MKNFSTCLWFDDQAEEAAKFYASVFANSKIGRVARYSETMSGPSGKPPGSVMTVEMQLEDLDVVCLNGGPMFKFTPALSFVVNCSSEAEINEKWKKLSEGGSVRMGLDKYPWSERYGWTADKFGVDWQLILSPAPQKINPSFLFVDSLFGRGEEAVNFYTSIFPNSKIESIARDEATKSIMHCAFSLNGQKFTLMEGAGKHGHTFTHAFSLMANCKTQKEIDDLWCKLSEGGSTEQCGWLQDKFGVSWQITPFIMAELSTDPAKSEKVMQALLKMTKIDIATLERAAR